MIKVTLKYAIQIVLIICFLSVTEFSQIKPTDTPFDTYGDISWRFEKARLYNFALALKNEPNDVGYIIYNVGKDDCFKNVESRINRSVKYLTNKQKISSDRIVVVYAGLSEKFKVILQPIPRSEKIPNITEPSAEEKSKTDKNCNNK